MEYRSLFFCWSKQTKFINYSNFIKFSTTFVEVCLSFCFLFQTATWYILYLVTSTSICLHHACPSTWVFFPYLNSLCMLLQRTCCIIPQNWINIFSLVFCQKKKLTELTWSTTGWSGRKGSVTPTTILWEQVDDKEEEKKTERTVTTIFIKETTSSPLISPEI